MQGRAIFRQKARIYRLIIHVNGSVIPFFGLKTSIVTTDFSEAANKAAAFATQFANAHHAALVLVHAFHFWLINPADTGIDAAIGAKAVRDVCQRELTHLAQLLTHADGNYQQLRCLTITKKLYPIGYSFLNYLVIKKIGWNKSSDFEEIIVRTSQRHKGHQRIINRTIIVKKNTSKSKKWIDSMNKGTTALAKL